MTSHKIHYSTTHYPATKPSSEEHAEQLHSAQKRRGNRLLELMVHSCDDMVNAIGVSVVVIFFTLLFYILMFYQQDAKAQTIAPVPKQAGELLEDEGPLTEFSDSIIPKKLPSDRANARIKDIVKFEGVRENMLVGYGLVVGLNGTGDNLKNAAFTEKGLSEFLGKLGINTKGSNLKTKNVAAVTVTAKLPPFSRQGSTLDVEISTLGDAKNLQGGTLLATPLLGADGEVYAVAQGAIQIGGFNGLGDDNKTQAKSVPTRGFIASGGIIEKEIDFALNSLSSIKLALNNPDISTATRIGDVINTALGSGLAQALDPGTVEVQIPGVFSNNVVQLLSQIEQLQVEPDQVARVVIDEASGTVVIGENVRLSTVAIAQGNLLVSVDNGTNTQIAPTLVNNGSRGTNIAMMEETASLQELVDGLNALGVAPRDLVTVLQNIKAAGALQAEIKTR